jgi:hypothetical protein
MNCRSAILSLAIASLALLTGTGCETPDARARQMATPPHAGELFDLPEPEVSSVPYGVGVEGRQPERQLVLAPTYEPPLPTPEEQALLDRDKPRPFNWREFYQPPVANPMVLPERGGAMPGIEPPAKAQVGVIAADRVSGRSPVDRVVGHEPASRVAGRNGETTPRAGVIPADKIVGYEPAGRLTGPPERVPRRH